MRRTLFALTGLVSRSRSPRPRASTRPLPHATRRGDRDDLRRQRPRLGHGVGMSQYGALGYANEGWTYDQILGHFYPGAELGPGAGRPRARARRRGEGPVTVRSSRAVPRPRRLRQDVSAPGRRGRARAEAARAVNGTPTELAGPLLFLPGTAPLELDRAYRGQIEVAVTGAEAGRGQRRRARAVPPGRRRAGDAERLARRGPEGAGRRRALVRARAPPHRQGVRPLRRRSQPGLRRRRRRAAAHDGGGRRRRRARCCSGRASRSTRSSTPPPAARRSTRPRSSASRCRTSSGSTIRTARSRPSTAGGPRRSRRRRFGRGSSCAGP